MGRDGDSGGHGLKGEAVPCINAWDCVLWGLRWAVTPSSIAAVLAKPEGQKGLLSTPAHFVGPVVKHNPFKVSVLWLLKPASPRDGLVLG